MGRIKEPHPISPLPHLKKNVLVLLGPTASGKTPISLLIARQLNAEILSADSRQVYKLLEIGTAKASREEREAVKHYFVDELMPDKKFDAAGFGQRGRTIIDDIFRRNMIPLVVGGSGLYIQALIDGLFEGPPADDALREELELRISEGGSEALLEELRAFDPDAAANMLPSHTRRIIRAHEVYRLTGIPISRLQETRIKINFTPVMAGLQWDRARLYQRINRRVDWMMESGFLDEVKRLRAAGYTQRINALNTVGYKEVFRYLDGELTLERAVELMKQNSRRYAKRQLTWFRADKRIRWFDISGERDYTEVAGRICSYYRQTLS